MGFWRNLTIAAACLAGAVPATAQYVGNGGRAPMTPEQKAAAEAALAPFTSPTLTRFRSEEEFRRYLGAVLSSGRARGLWWASSGHIQFAQAGQSDAVEPICPDGDPACAAPPGEVNDGADSIVVTAQGRSSPARAASTPASRPSNANITNNQMQGVDEGDIVKQIGHYLLVLQDGRIFVIDTRARGGRRLALAERMNVYRDRAQHMWYDEMLVFGDRVLITGYSYQQQATELSVFRLDMASGRLSRQGVFYMSSNDYYSSTNYASRLVGDNLVVYTPFSVHAMTRPNFRWPMVRRWVDGEDRLAADRRSRPLFDAGQIYRPVRDGGDMPTVHTVSVCPLGDVGPGRELACRSSAFVGPSQAQWYVTEQDAYLWTNDANQVGAAAGTCGAPPAYAAEDYARAVLFRVPVDGAAPLVAATRGVPPDQFSLDARNGHFRALVRGGAIACRGGQPEARLAFLDLPLRRFSSTLAEVGGDRYTAMPGVKSANIANRFTETHLVYGSVGMSSRGFAENSMPPAYVVPVDRPAGVRAIPVRHTVIRAEQAGSDIVVTGYRNQRGLIVTLIDLDGNPRIADQVQLVQRFEAEGRSHAFNSLIEADGSGVMGLPTIVREGWSSRAAWRSSASDLSYLTVDTRGRLRPVGELERRFDYSDEGSGGVAGYTCEVSCIDWYGNSRPIFTDGRVFGLTGTELIEGRIRGGQIHEVQRLNIALSRPPQLAAR
ncbi:MAG TPA: beta-propeller domain-containing protein [Allosphingosinicella sp.]|nr:beta-propeller domain-containing protein [Allosphingosinicella sp.]